MPVWQEADVETEGQRGQTEAKAASHAGSQLHRRSRAQLDGQGEHFWRRQLAQPLQRRRVRYRRRPLHASLLVSHCSHRMPHLLGVNERKRGEGW